MLASESLIDFDLYLPIFYRTLTKPKLYNNGLLAESVASRVCKDLALEFNMPNPAPATGRPSFHGYDFAGPYVFHSAGIVTADAKTSPGAFILTFGLPALVYLFLFSCNDVSGCPAPSLLSPSSLTLETFKKDIGWQGLPTIFNTEAFLATLGWYGLSLLLYAILPASESEGTVLRSGGRLKYRNNGRP